MNTEKFTMHDAIVGISDIRFIVAIMFNTTDRLFIREVLDRADYGIGSPESFANRLYNIHHEWIINNKDIDKVKYKGSFSLVDPFRSLEKQLKSEQGHLQFQHL